MKKLTLISAVLITGLALGGCSTTSKKSTTSKTKTQQVHKKYYFDGKTANLKDEKITIDKVSFYKGDETTNDKNLIVFDYTITNKSDKDIDAISGWQAVFNAYQDNKNTEGKLEVGSLPNDTSEEILHNQDQIIKKGGHVKCRTAYQLDSNSKPVVLKAIKGSDGDFLGKKAFKLGKFKSAEISKPSGSEQTNVKTNKVNQQSSAPTNNKKAGSQPNNNSRSGDWHNDPQLWSDVQNNDNWKGSMYQNATPQERYDYIEGNHDYWAARDPNYNN